MLKSYLITDPKFYSSDVEVFSKCLTSVYEKHKNIDYACFRDKTCTNAKELASLFVKISNKFHIKTFINSNISLAYSLNATGVHLTSLQYDEIKKAKKSNLDIICSTHNIDDILNVIDKDVKKITYSPIFCNKYNLNAKTINGLKKIVDLSLDVDIFALGGIISDVHIKKIKDLNIYGFASIRYFV